MEARRALSIYALGLLVASAAPGCGAAGAADGASAGGPALAAPAPDAATTPGSPADPWTSGPPFGARRFPNGDVEVRVRAPNATRLELCLFRNGFGEPEKLRVPMDRTGDAFRLRVTADALRAAGVDGVLYYGLRAFGPNWPYDAAFAPGSSAGFVADVDARGNRMNPNKLLLDPYALEVSHDPITVAFGDGSAYRSGATTRAVDSGPFAPKGVIVASATPCAPPAAGAPSRALRDDVLYEVHVRALTMADPDVPEAERGTFAGAARRAKYLRGLGVTAIELLPIAETPNDQNDRTPDDASGDNYWGYSTLAYLAPDRRYAADKSPGGPTRELHAMVDAFHAEGVKVFVDVVYNHTAEGGARGDAATLYSLRGLDEATYYELGADPKTEVNSNGVGANLATANPVAADLVVDSLRYWHDAFGIDGFRFDLAAVVGNGCASGCYRFDRGGLLTRIANELPARPDSGGAGVDLVAEPWGVASGTYQVGAFPRGWSEWNDRFRDTVKRDLNRLGVEAVTPRQLSLRLSGSPDLYDHDGRAPAASIDYVASHDGMTFADLFRYDQKNNDQAWPFGPSSGGPTNDLSSSQGGDAIRQRTVMRTAFALAALSAGVPMFAGGDERLHGVRGNDNPYNVDSTATWIDWSPSADADAFSAFVSRILAFRATHGALRPGSFWKENARWLRDDGQTADAAYLDAGDRHYLGVVLDGAALGDASPAIFVAYNGWSGTVTAHLPAPPSGRTWVLAGDTSTSAEAWGNWTASGGERDVPQDTRDLDARSLAVFVAR